MEKQKKIFSKNDLMDKYSDYLLSEGKRPANVYLFAKNLGLSENDFYKYFSGFDSLEKEFLVYFFEQSLKLTKKIKDYQELSSKEKLLNFYYIFFENLNRNRSLVLMILKTDMRSKLRKLRYLKKSHQELVQSLHFEDWEIFQKMPERLRTFNNKSKEEVLWIHFLSILRFWGNDQSAGFEKTDLYIEKSIDTGFEFVHNPLVDKFFDFGKFLWNEKFQ